MEFFIGWAAVTKVTLVYLRGGKKITKPLRLESRTFFLRDKQISNLTVHSPLYKNRLHGLFQDTPMQQWEGRQQSSTQPKQQTLPCQPLPSCGPQSCCSAHWLHFRVALGKWCALWACDLCHQAVAFPEQRLAPPSPSSSVPGNPTAPSLFKYERKPHQNKSQRVATDFNR